MFLKRFFPVTSSIASAAASSSSYASKKKNAPQQATFSFSNYGKTTAKTYSHLNEIHC